MIIKIELLKLECGENIFQRGESISDLENFTLKFTQLEYSLKINSLIKNYKTSINIDTDNMNIIKSSCTCPYYENNKTHCKHIAALSIRTDNMLNAVFAEIIKDTTNIKSNNGWKKLISENMEILNSNPPLFKKEPETVSTINRKVKDTLENNPVLKDILVQGEISQYTLNSSGHSYFSIKDSKSLLSCVLFKWAKQPEFKPKTGDKVILTGQITVYEPRGQYQLNVSSIKKAGDGDLYAKFLKLKEKLQNEGLFEQSHKKNIPIVPQKIGIVSSPTGAVIKDIINTTTRRFPHVELILYPTNVQGSGAEESIINGINYFEKRNDINTLIITRGGGSMEDLWCFNDETLARTIYHCKIPIISAIGHETDNTICDFVADKRAPTPTAAAELATPNISDILITLNQNQNRIINTLNHNLRNKKEKIARIESEIEHIFNKKMQHNNNLLDTFNEKLNLLSSKNVINRGYSITLFNNKSVRDVTTLKTGDTINTIIKNGKITSKIEKTYKK